MKSVLFIVLLIFPVFLFQTTNAQYQQICKFCSGELQIPTDWKECQSVLKMACSWLITAPEECVAAVEAADMSSSYDNVYPYIIELKDMACDRFRNFC